MNKKLLGIVLGIIALLFGGAMVYLGVQKIQTAENTQGVLPKGDIERAVGESQKESVVFEHPVTKARISYPKNWTVTQDKEGNGVSFSIYSGAVNLRLVTDDFTSNKEPVTLDEYSNVLMAQGKEQAAAQNVTVAPISDSAVTLAGSPGHQWQYTVTIGDVKGHGMQVWTVKDNKSYVLTYTAANELFDAFTPVVQKMILSLQLP